MDLFAPLLSHLPGYPCAWSPCKRYRYTLWRVWVPRPERVMMVIGLNPSTATETEDDPTIRRCIGFARREKCDALLMTNAFAFRATLPPDMKAAADPVGPDNDSWLVRGAGIATLIVAAWGIHGDFRGRDAQVKSLIPQLLCFGTTGKGHPKHPLYPPGDTRLTPLL